jgi:hypothetical protein
MEQSDLAASRRLLRVAASSQRIEGVAAVPPT